MSSLNDALPISGRSIVPYSPHSLFPPPPAKARGGSRAYKSGGGESVTGLVQGLLGHFTADAHDFLRAPEFVELADVARDLDHQLRRRSEEHTSELQSLMRISYAVFCLKKKT